MVILPNLDNDLKTDAKEDGRLLGRCICHFSSLTLNFHIQTTHD